MNVFSNAGHTAEQGDKYDWIHTGHARGGSGIREDNPASTSLPARHTKVPAGVDKRVPFHPDN